MQVILPIEVRYMVYKEMGYINRRDWYNRQRQKVWKHRRLVAPAWIHMGDDDPFREFVDDEGLPLYKMEWFFLGANLSGWKMTKYTGGYKPWAEASRKRDETMLSVSEARLHTLHLVGTVEEIEQAEFELGRLERVLDDWEMWEVDRNCLKQCVIARHVYS